MTTSSKNGLCTERSLIRCNELLLTSVVSVALIEKISTSLRIPLLHITAVVEQYIPPRSSTK